MSARKQLNPQYTRKVVRRFETAVENYAFRGIIPVNESEAAFQAYRSIEVEYREAKLALLALIDRLNGFSIKRRVKSD